ILAAMLLPALQQARESAKSVKCVNNQKGMISCTLMYIDDNNGVCTPPRWWANSPALPDQYWILRLEKYAGTNFCQMNPPEDAKNRLAKSIWVCPSVVLPNDFQWWLTGYGMVLALPPMTQADGQKWGTWEITAPVWGRIRQPAGAPVFADALDTEWHVTDGTYLNTRHSGRASRSCADGHVDSVTKNEAKARFEQSSYKLNGTY
ncbi:MAG: hypothetical protein HPZ91_14230, partial [Lentisphaeria bacterium]|nr:hypothetical protein [Lentisphaeria bacterium]